MTSDCSKIEEIEAIIAETARQMKQRGGELNRLGCAESKSGPPLVIEVEEEHAVLRRSASGWGARES